MLDLSAGEIALVRIIVVIKSLLNQRERLHLRACADSEQYWHDRDLTGPFFPVMAVHLLKELIFWAAEKGFRESEVRICQKQRKKYHFRLDQLWCCIRILLKPEARATGHGHASA